MPQPMPQMAQLALALLAVFAALMFVFVVVMIVIERRNTHTATYLKRSAEECASVRREERAELFHKVRAARREQDRDPKHRAHRNPGGGTAA